VPSRPRNTRLLRSPNVAKVLSAFRDRAVTIATKDIRGFAHEEQRGFVKRIEDQNFQSFSRPYLSWATLAKRRKRGITSRKVLIARGRYVDNIRVHERPRPKDRAHDFLIGVHEDVRVADPDTGAPTDLPMTWIAKVNEVGSEKLRIPARPHWWPYFIEMLHQRVPALKKRIEKNLHVAWKQARRTR